MSKRIIRTAVGLILFLALVYGGRKLFRVARTAYYHRHYTAAYAAALESRAGMGGDVYYLSADGNDDNDGKSPASAWQTLDKVNQTVFYPGDQILLRAGQTFRGSLYFDREDLGAPDRPILIGSYGAGRATIEAGDTTGIALTNTSGYVIKNLHIAGSGRTQNTSSGIYARVNLPGNIKLPFLRFDSLEVYGFGVHGISIAGEKDKSGFRDVRINSVQAHDNARTGVEVYGFFDMRSEKYAHENVTIRYVEAFNNTGISDPLIGHTGSGIILSDVDGGLIERCVAHHNGRLCNSEQGGPVGIWAWDAKDVVIQFNESYENQTDGPKDGGGFDLDGGCVNSIMQYNYSHDNDGPGYLLAQFPYARSFQDNIVRYNISQNDARKNSTAAIYFWGDIRNTQVYNNTIFVSAGAQSNPAAIAFEKNLRAPRYQKPLPSEVFFSNNILLTKDELAAVRIPEAIEELVFRHNYYFSPDSTFRIQWIDQTFSDLAAWQSATLQEMVDGASSGFAFDPLLVAPGLGPTFNSADSLHRLRAYELRPDSPLIDAGLDLRDWLEADMGDLDFGGDKIPAGRAYDPGACEFAPTN